MRMQVDEELQRLTHDEIISFYGDCIMSSGKQRRKLVVGSVSQNHGRGPFQLQCKADSILDIDETKAGLPVSVAST